MKARIKRLLNRLIQPAPSSNPRFKKYYSKYSEFTMMSRADYTATMAVVEHFKSLKGDVIECGVWRGGMIAGMAELLGSGRKYYLCDSFEGLPEAQEIDGKAARKWQNDKNGPTYYNNCAAEASFAEKAMGLAQADYRLVKGWFNNTLPTLETDPIAFLRLDADWYDSMYCCMENLYPRVIKNGIILIDDYFVWDGCSKAIHAYLSNTMSASRIHHTPFGITYIIKND
ncbi:MAG TPA: TylF/MycF/NovP-related O-methyltransferase [Mucilaginibacter sp.]|nr:TylF/MycF/NovP-related O-methyltransferase [Mucilaginibacter sp.]